MTRADVAVGAVLAAAFGVMAWQAAGMAYGTEFAPGPGFTPLWLGAIGAVLSVALAVRAREAGPAPPTDAPAEFRVAVAALGVAAVALAAPVIGLVLAIAVYLFLLALAVARLSLRAAVASAGGTALIVYAVFERSLNVPFPKGPFGF